MTEEALNQITDNDNPAGGGTPLVESPVTDGGTGTPEPKNIPDTVPYSRFQEVNEEKKNLRDANERLLTILQNQGGAVKPQETAPAVQEETPALLAMPGKDVFTKEVDGYDEYDEAAHLAAISKTATENALRTLRHEQKKETGRIEGQKRNQQGQDLLQVITTAHPDFPVLMQQTQPSDAVREALFALDEDDRQGVAEVAYFLAKNPAEMARLNALHPTRAIAAVGKLVAKFTLPEAKSKIVSDAPEPKGPVKTTEVPANFDPLKSSTEDYIRHSGHPAVANCPWLVK